MRFEVFDSTVLTGAGYDAGELRIVLANGAVWSYVGVPPDIWRKMQADDSKGSFYASHIKGKYHSRQIKGPDDGRPPPRPVQRGQLRNPSQVVVSLSDSFAEYFGDGKELVEPDYLNEDA